VSRPSLVVHGHFYQPPRVDPFSGAMPADPTAAPARDWNARISAECYRPNALAGNYGAMSWDIGPTLASWMEEGDPLAYDGFATGDAGANGMAQPFHHAIMPLAAAHDRRTEIRWGLRDFQLRFGRRPTGMWLPETAVDLATLRMLADEGIDHTVLAPWQVDSHDVDTRRPVRIPLGDGREMLAVLYDGLLSAAVSFEPSATVDADAFVRDRLVPRFWQPDEDHHDGHVADGTGPLVVIATDGELYGHHQPHREQFLSRLVGLTAPDDLPYDRPSLTTALAALDRASVPVVALNEATSWSCHHGVTRWSGDCDCVVDGQWKEPLRSALERLAGGVDALTDDIAGSFAASLDVWAARDAWVDVVIGRESAAAFVARHGGDERLAVVLEAQRWRLAMFASCGWFWEDPVRPETAGSLRAAARAARLVDRVAGSNLERRLVADLALIPEHDGLDGVAVFRRALAAVGADSPGPA
jgi:hypothetical protein